MNKKVIIAIDGFSSCGKSTLAKALALHLHYRYLDTGAMYRAVTLGFIREDVDIQHSERVVEVLQSLNLDVQFVDNIQKTLINGQDVSESIRSMQVSDWVSEVSAIPQVRKHVVSQQQRIGQQKGVVVEGRDIGTVVFPDAELKIFLTAQPEIRIERRYQELKSKGIHLSREEVARNIEKRDYIDSNREVSPLRQADDAHVLDNSHLTVNEQIQIIQGWLDAL